MANGVAPTSTCGMATGSGTITFDPHHHFQRTGLLLLTLKNGDTSTDYVYIAFAPIGESETQNGWILSYTYGSSGLTPVASFITTPYGTGGGVWEAGAGLASDGAYIYAPTGNGTFDANTGGSDYGDSLVKLNASSLMEAGYYTPSDWNTRCLGNADLDFGSGGVLLFPDPFFQNHPDLLVSADKKSVLYVVDRGTPGGVGGQVQKIMQPPNPLPPLSQPGYWSSPAYWKSYNVQNGFQYNLYYAADETNTSLQPWPMYRYKLLTSGSNPINTSGPSASTTTVFCGNPHAPTPSISSSGTTASTGIAWAIESRNKHYPIDCSQMPQQAVLHAYDATSLVEKYNSGSLVTPIGPAANFPTPTIFNGRVYMGTKNEVDVFGLCPGPPGVCLP
jgi:hypothetical protein